LSGDILAKEGFDSSTTLTDILSTIWSEYNEIGLNIFKEEKLNFMIIQNEGNNILVTNIYGYIIAMRSPEINNLGLAKLHLEALSNFLCEKFSEFKNKISDNNINI